MARLTEFDDSFNTLTTNLLSVPYQVGAMVTILAITLVSEKVHERSFVAMAQDIWTLPFLIALRVLPNGQSPWLFYVCILYLWAGVFFILI